MNATNTSRLKPSILNKDRCELSLFLSGGGSVCGQGISVVSYSVADCPRDCDNNPRLSGRARYEEKSHGGNKRPRSRGVREKERSRSLCLRRSSLSFFSWGDRTSLIFPPLCHCSFPAIRGAPTIFLALGALADRLAVYFSFLFRWHKTDKSPEWDTRKISGHSVPASQKEKLD